jgi:hypothetical protein
MAPKRKITTRKTRRTLTRVLPDFAGAAAAAWGRCAGGTLAAGGGGAAEERTGGPEADVPQTSQNACPSANGLPQFLQKPAILPPEGFFVQV